MLALGGADALVRLYKMAFDGFSAQGTVFGGMGNGQAWSAGVVAGVDGGEPYGFYREICSYVEVLDEGSNAGQVVGIEYKGDSNPLGGNG